MFNPYTGIKTNLLFFTKGTPTKEVWFYEHQYPAGVKNYSKTRPMRIEEFAVEEAWWGSEADGFAARVENEFAWKVSLDELKDRNWNLDCKNPHVGEQISHDPDQLLRDYAQLQGEISQLRDQLKAVLAEALEAMSDVAIYESASGQIAVTVEHDSVWLRQEQLAELFGRDRTVIGRHIRNVFAEGELERESNVQNLHIAGSDKPVAFYNLDVIISLGYRVKSREGTRFRQWANQVLKQHLTRGYTLNRARFEANARELEAALELVRKAARTPELGEAGGRGLVEIVSRYTQTFLWLQRYDEGLLTEPTGSPGGELLDATQARRQLAELKTQLMARGEASDLFARERGAMAWLHCSVTSNKAYSASRPTRA